MKKIILVTALATAAVPAHAGSQQAPQMDVTVMTQNAGSAAVQYVIPAVFLAMLLLLMAAPGASPQV